MPTQPWSSDRVSGAVLLGRFPLCRLIAAYVPAAEQLVREGRVSVAQAGRDLDLHENVLRKWVREQEVDPGSAFPGNGVMSWSSRR